MWKILLLVLIFIFIGHEVWLLTKARKDKGFYTIWLSVLAGLGLLYLFYGLHSDGAVEIIPLIVIILLIAIVSHAILKGKESVAGFSTLAILCIGGLLYYMIVFLDYEILGTYTLRNIKKYDEQLIAARDSLVSLDRYHKRVIRDVETAKREIEIQMERIALYTADVADTRQEIQKILAKQKEIENTINGFDKRLSLITQEVIIEFCISNRKLTVF